MGQNCAHSRTKGYGLEVSVRSPVTGSLQDGVQGRGSGPVLSSPLKSPDRRRSAGLLQGAWVTSQAPPSAAHTACLLDADQLHSTVAAVLGSHLMVLPSLKRWRLLLHLSCTSANSLFGALFMMQSLNFSL